MIIQHFFSFCLNGRDDTHSSFPFLIFFLCLLPSLVRFFFLFQSIVRAHHFYKLFIGAFCCLSFPNTYIYFWSFIFFYFSSLLLLLYYFRRSSSTPQRRAVTSTTPLRDGRTSDPSSKRQASATPRRKA